ncbi:hypothetical protein HNQ51_002520 [Inhella inkyongensis]|uniref:Solute-binding protein family 3/N-terminal domain-containing protein n=1 Tax=Inhella inkyongensis TaxID=392593 RepID=A0A840S9K6_9BURK|nr:hypothetical protein [Inhella inkyongensis]MBB5205201.1 hypothetical protein [Inhella inkyongensis]
MSLRVRVWMVALGLGLGLGLLPGVARAAVACPQPLVVSFLDGEFPPFLYGNGTQFATPKPGWAVEWVRQTLAELGCEASLTRGPFRRTAQQMAVDAVQIAVGFAHLPERELTMRFPHRADGSLDDRLALLTTDVVLFGLVEPRGGAAGQVVRKVGIVTGSIEESVARERRLPMEAAPTHRANLAKLRAGRIDLVLGVRQVFSASELVAEPAVQVLEPPLQVVRYFAPTSQALYERHPDFVKAFWLGMCERARRQTQRPAACQ